MSGAQKKEGTIMNKTISAEAKLAANIIMFFFTALILSSILGVWLKLFWFGWVMSP